MLKHTDMDNKAKYKITLERDGKRSWGDPDKYVSEYREVKDRIYEFIEVLLIQSSQFDADKNEALSERLFDAYNGFASERSPEGRDSKLFDEPELPMLTVKEVAELAGRTKWAIYDLVHKNKIPHHRPRPDRIMFDRKEVMEWMQEGNHGMGNRSNEGRGSDVRGLNSTKAVRRQEAAKILGITPGHLDELVSEGKIPRYGKGKGAVFIVGDLLKYREEHPLNGKKSIRNKKH